MNDNKNIRTPFKAFAAIAGRQVHARVTLKGNDMLYASQQRVELSRHGLTLAEIQRVQPRPAYTGQTLPFRQIGILDQAMDAYVSPYAAEGFNLPALEAAACAMPLICTAVGSTDDFTSADFALPIAAKEQQVMIREAQGWLLAPLLDSLSIGRLHVDSCISNRVKASDSMIRTHALRILKTGADRADPLERPRTEDVKGSETSWLAGFPAQAHRSRLALCSYLGGGARIPRLARNQVDCGAGPRRRPPDRQTMN
jgi:hypothetical protein